MAKKWSKQALKALKWAARAGCMGTSMLNLGRHYTALLNAGLVEHREGCRATDVYITPAGQAVLRGE